MAILCISLNAQIESPLFDHVGGLGILKVKRGWFHTDRPDQRPFISFQLDSYGCMPLNPLLTWTCRSRWGEVYRTYVVAAVKVCTLFFHRIKSRSLRFIHSFGYTIELVSISVVLSNTIYN